MQREVYEETGVRVLVDKLAGVYSNIKSHIVMFDFLCEFIEGEPRSRNGIHRSRGTNPVELMRFHAPDNYICPFCLLARGIENEHVLSVQSDVIYRDDVVTAFISSHQLPNNAGNVLVIPNQHFENIYEFPAAFAVNVHQVVRAIALAQKAAFDCDGISTRQHNEPAGNQDVWHYHIHVTPRYKDDGLYGSKRKFMPAEARAQLAAKIRALLQIDW